jgi:serine phosphatase RsbU (regulator of sigma subunit)
VTVQRFTLPPAPTPPLRTLPQRIRTYVTRTFAGRLLLGAVIVFVLEKLGAPIPDLLGVLDAIVLFTFGSIGLYHVGRFLVRAFLWRIRTKLLLSYMFIAVVPLVLLAGLFMLAGLLFTGLVAGHMVASEIGRDAEGLRMVAESASLQLPKEGPGMADNIAASIAPARSIHPELAYTVMRAGRVLASAGEAPRALPTWWGTRHGFAGLVKDGPADILRAVSTQGDVVVVVQAPVDVRLFADLEQSLGIHLLTTGGKMRAQTDEQGRANIHVDAKDVRRIQGKDDDDVNGVPFVAPIDRTDWVTGETSVDPLTFAFDPLSFLQRLSPGAANITGILVRVLAVVGVVFLVVYFVALLIGFLLARSITKSIHNLSVGTERLRNGDFVTAIPIGSRDQLGDLAESFNLMARGIADAVRQQSEKERLEEELRIARQIQMRLLPQDTVSMSGIRLAALCLPATEVGGDYYDLLPLSPTRMGVLVADVSGKGTSAALYMAELKGLVLSLSRIYDSPAALLREANRILADNMDSRSFITMTYAIVDTVRRTMRFARAGHNPIIQFEAGTGATRVLTPAGLGLGIDRGERFDQILEESEVPLHEGDVFLFFTDGLSEAMNGASELFGERRLRDVIEASEGMGSEEMKETILSEIRAFVGGEAQHDDMTMVILKVV